MRLPVYLLRVFKSLVAAILHFIRQLATPLLKPTSLSLSGAGKCQQPAIAQIVTHADTNTRNVA
jgi:hypothetical protein